MDSWKTLFNPGHVIRTSCWCYMRELMGFLIDVFGCGAREEDGRIRVWRCQQSNIKHGQTLYC